jgi:hypothetical protein
MKLGTATTLASGKLTYHSTVVCEALGNGRTRLNSGGWKTATTKKRMNQYAGMMGYPWRVFQKDHDWFVDLLGDGETILDYNDLMMVNGDVK